MKKLREYSKWAATFLFFVALITVYKTFDNISKIGEVIATVMRAFKPFFAAFFLAYVLNLPAMRIKKLLDGLKFRHSGFLKKHSEGISIAVVYIVGIGIVTWVVYALVPDMYTSLIKLSTDLPQYIRSLVEKLSRYDEFKRGGIFENGTQAILNTLNRLTSSIDVSQFGKYAMGVVNLTSGVLSTVVAVIASIYMLIDKERIKESILKFSSIFIKGRKKDGFLIHAKEVNDIFTNYIYARLICCAVMAVSCTVILSLLKVEYALILGLFIGAMDMIPYFGSIVSTATAMVATFITGGPIQGITVSIILLIMQQIDGNILGPKVMGDSLEIRPLWIIIAVTVGGSLFGFVGMLLSVPVVAVLRIVFQELMNIYEEKVNNSKSEIENE